MDGGESAAAATAEGGRKGQGGRHAGAPFPGAPRATMWLWMQRSVLGVKQGVAAHIKHWGPWDPRTRGAAPAARALQLKHGRLQTSQGARFAGPNMHQTCTEHARWCAPNIMQEGGTKRTLLPQGGSFVLCSSAAARPPCRRRCCRRRRHPRRGGRPSDPRRGLSPTRGRLHTVRRASSSPRSRRRG